MKVAVVTGASGGIGKATVKAFIEKGYFVFSQYNSNIKGIEQLIADLKKEGLADFFAYVKADLSTEEGANALYTAVSKSFKHVDVLVNNAGVDLYKLVTDTTASEWDYVQNVNVRAGFLLSKLFLPQMISRQEGKIIFVSSIWGKQGACMESAYSASKWAQIGFAKSLAKEVAPSGVTVNCVCPGVVDTPMNDCFNEQEKKEIINSIPMGRICKPEEIANAILFLSSDEARYITGQELVIDGGFTL